jgi:hypothetical protein
LRMQQEKGWKNIILILWLLSWREITHNYNSLNKKESKREFKSSSH